MMPFAIMNTLYTVQRMVESLFEDLDSVRVYIDNGFIDLKSIEEHTNGLIVIFGHVKENDLKIKLKKCGFTILRIEVLCYIVLKHGVEADLGKMKCVSEALLSQAKKELRSFLMFCYFNRRFISRF